MAGAESEDDVHYIIPILHYIFAPCQSGATHLAVPPTTSRVPMAMLTVLTGLCLLASPILFLYLFRQSLRRRRYDWARQCMLITGGSLAENSRAPHPPTHLARRHPLGAQGIGRNVVELCLGKGCKSIIIVDIKEPEFSLPKSTSISESASTGC